MKPRRQLLNEQRIIEDENKVRSGNEVGRVRENGHIFQAFPQFLPINGQ